MARLRLDAHAEVVGSGGESDDRDDFLHEGSIRRVHLHDQHASTDLRLHLIVHIDVEGGALLTLGGGNGQGGDGRLRGRGAGANFQILADSNEVGVFKTDLRLARAQERRKRERGSGSTSETPTVSRLTVPKHQDTKRNRGSNRNWNWNRVRTEVVEQVHEVVNALEVAVHLAESLIDTRSRVQLAQGLAITRNTNV